LNLRFVILNHSRWCSMICYTYNICISFCINKHLWYSGRKMQHNTTDNWEQWLFFPWILWAISNINLNNRRNPRKKWKNIHFWIDSLSRILYMRKKSYFNDIIIKRLFYLVLFLGTVLMVCAVRSLLSTVFSDIVVLFISIVFACLWFAFLFNQARVTELQEKLAAVNKHTVRSGL